MKPPDHLFFKAWVLILLALMWITLTNMNERVRKIRDDVWTIKNQMEWERRR